MKLQGFAALACAAVVVASPTVAVAQSASRDLAITTLAKGAHGGPAQAVTRAIDNAADYRALLGAAPTGVDFSREVVLVAAMGVKRTGGYAIEIKRVEYMTIGIMASTAFVDVAESSPAPGTIVTMALTEPYHVVKCAKGPIHWIFRSNAPAAAQFESLKLTTAGGFAAFSDSIALAPDGTASVERSFHTVGPRNVALKGKATAGELKDVNDAFAKADVATLPDRIPDPRPIADIPSITVQSKVAGKAYHTTANSGYYASYEGRLKPLITALRAISDRLIKQGEERTLNGLVEVQSDGTVRINENRSSLWSVTNEPFKSILKAYAGKYVQAKANVHPQMFGGTCEILSVIAKADRDMAVRAMPYSLAPKLGSIAKGASVVITGKANRTYWEVELNGRKGYVQMSGVTVGSATRGIVSVVPGSP